jgi:CheY-like chemotaxis protein
MTRLRALVADDDPFVLLMWTKILEAAFDAEVVAASDGASAIARLCEGDFDLLVTDLRMPRVSGMDVLRYARARWPSLPAFLATGDATQQLYEETDRLGVDLVEKPFDVDDACRRISTALHVTD